MKNLIIILLLFVTVSSYAQINTIKVGGIDTAFMLDPYKTAYPRQAISLVFTTSGSSGASTATYSNSTGVFTINIPQYSGGSSGITALTGDVTASGTGSVAATLATVNSNVGTFKNATITANGKGLITAATTANINDSRLVFSDNGAVKDTSTLVYDRTNGNVGIGLTTPLQKLDVNGQIKIGLGNVSQIYPRSDAGQLSIYGSVTPVKGAYILLNSANPSGFSDSGSALINYGDYTTTAPTNSLLRFRYVNNGRAWDNVSSNANGYMGINTNSAHNPLSVEPRKYTTGQASQSGATVTGVGTIWTSDMVGDYFKWPSQTFPADRITAVNSTTSITLALEQPVGNATVSDYEILRVGLQVTSLGRVGIGTASPTQAFHVTGQARIDSLLTGTSSDSLIVVNNGTLKKVLQSSVTGTGTLTTISSPNSTLSIANPTTTPTVDFNLGHANFFTTNQSATIFGVGTGSATPASVLHVVETSTSTPRGILADQYNTGTQGSRITMRKARGTFASPTVITTGDVLGSWTTAGHDGTGFIDAAKILVTSTGTIGTNIVPAFMDLQTMNSAGTLTTGLSISSAQAITLPALNATGIVHNSSAGLLSTSLLSLTADVTGILGSTNGGSGINNAGTLTWGSGGTLGTNAYTSTAYAPVSTTVTGGSITWPGTIYSTPTTGSFSSGTLTFAPTLATQTANTIFSGPSSGSAATPTWRALVAADIPSLSGTYLPLAGGTLTGQVIQSTNGALSTPSITGVGTWITGGTTTTTKPYLLIEPTGTTSTGWASTGTGLGVNAASGFGGKLIDLQIAGVPKFTVTSGGSLTMEGNLAVTLSIIGTNGISTNSTILNSNLYAAAGTSLSSSVSTAQYITGGNNIQFRAGVRGSSSTVATAGNDVFALAIGDNTFTEATSGTSALAGGLYIKTQSFTNGSGATTDFQNAYFGDAPTGATNNWSINAGASQFRSKTTWDATNTGAGTTGNQTINKSSGTVNIAAAGTTVTVTNSLVTTSSLVFAVIRTNDATAYLKNVVPASGSFVINLGAAATAEVSIGFWVIN